MQGRHHIEGMGNHRCPLGEGRLGLGLWWLGKSQTNDDVAITQRREHGPRGVQSGAKVITRTDW